MQKNHESAAITLVCLAVALGMTVAKAQTRRAEGGTIWVTERTTGGQSTVAAIDAATGESLGIVGVGDNPIGITVPVGTNKVYSSDENADQISVIDKDTFQVTHIVVGDKPHHLMASRNGRYVYVAQFGTNTVGVIDTQRGARLRDIVVSDKPEARTHAVWISRNGRYLYATNENSLDPTMGTFSKVDVREARILWEVVVGNRPSEVLVDEDIAYVSVRNEHTVKVYDIGGPEPQYLGQAEANFQPDTLSLTNDKRTLIVGLRQSPAGRPARMAFIDVATLATTYLELPPGTITGHQWLSSNGRFTYIALEGRLATATSSGIPGMVAVVDNRQPALVTTYVYPNQNIRPHGVFFEQPRQEDLDDDLP
jgi:DNA-binding beta-propeller fold protein YncE